jgi:methyl-accepting chemotaxis protein
MTLSMGKFIARLSIRIRIFLALSAVLVILAGVSVSAWLGLSGSVRQFGSFAQSVAVGDRAVKLEILVGDLQKAVDDFVKYGSPERRAAVTDAATALATHVAAMKKQATDGQNVALIGQIDAAAKQYTASVSELFRVMAERDSLVDKILNKTGADIRKLMAGIVETSTKSLDYDVAMHAGQAQGQFLLAGLVAGSFLETGKGADQVRSDIDQATAGLQGLASSLWQKDQRARLDELNKLLPAYRAGFEQLVKTMAERRKVLEDADNSGAAMRKIARTVKDNVEHEQQIARSKLLSATIASRTWMGSLSIAAILAAILIAFALSRSITKPVLGLGAAMRRLAEGDNDTAIPGIDRGDEIGRMAATVQVFRENALRVQQLQAEQQQVEQRAEAEKRRSIGELADTFESRVRAVCQAVGTAATAVRADASRMSNSAQDTSERSTAVATATEEAAQAMQTVASAAEELAASVAEIGHQASRSSDTAAAAVAEADQTNAVVQELAAAARMISDVINLIHEIASQTNLLALNATIEAARAGEAGKGFAVVASEVKSLAAQTAKATDEITGQVNAIQENTSRVVAAIQRIGQVIGEVNQSTGAIASAVEEQVAVTQDISRNVQQAAAGARDVSANISEVQSATAETGGAARKFVAAADDLVQQSTALDAEVAAFLAKIRAS